MGEIALSVFYGGLMTLLGIFAYGRMKKEFAEYSKAEKNIDKGVQA